MIESSKPKNDTPENIESQFCRFLKFFLQNASKSTHHSSILYQLRRERRKEEGSEEVRKVGIKEIRRK